jgi:hypothetical protein
LLDACAVRERQIVDRIDDPRASAASSDGEHDRRPVPRADDHVVRAAGAVEEVPGAKRTLLPLDEQQALAGEHEKVLLRTLVVVQADRLPGLENADVDPELAEGNLSLEVAVVAEVPGIAPPALARVEHEPAVAVGDEAELRLAQRQFRHGHAWQTISMSARGNSIEPTDTKPASLFDV